MKKIIILALPLFYCAAGLAETRYITDQLEITLRSGQSTKHQILRMLPSGMAVEVIENDEETKYSRIKTEQGDEGWVLTRYLEQQPSAREQLEKIRQQLASLQKDNRQLTQTVQTLKSENNTLGQERKNLTLDQNRLEQEISRIKRISSDPLAIDEENRALKKRILRLEQDLQTAQQDIVRLEDRTARDWFIVGAGVILLGMLIGLIIPKIRWRKKSSWGSL